VNEVREKMLILFGITYGAIRLPIFIKLKDSLK
jgi:hypothetical protein